MRTLVEDRQDRAAARLNIGRRVRVVVDENFDVPYELVDADTGGFVIDFARPEQVAAFIARYGCRDVSAEDWQ